MRVRSRLLMLGMALLFVSGASAAEKVDNYPYLGLDSGSSSGVKKKKSSAKKKAPAPLPTWQQAFKELTLDATEQSQDVRATPATVQTRVEEVNSPIGRAAYELDFSLESYRPAGRMKLSGFEAYRLESLGARPLPALSFRWLPLKPDWPRPTSIGVFTSAGYVQHPVSLIAPTGDPIDGTVLSTLKLQAGAVLAVQPSPDSPWSARLETGLGELRIVQSSNSSFANHAASETFASIAIYGERRIWSRVAAFVGYDHRMPLASGADEIDLESSNFKIGLSGGFH